MCARTRFPFVAATANPDKLARIRRLVGPDADLLPLPPEGRIDEPSPGEALLVRGGTATALQLLPLQLPPYALRR